MKTSSLLAQSCSCCTPPLDGLYRGSGRPLSFATPRLVCAAVPNPSTAPDTIFLGATVRTLDPANPVAEAIAVKNGRIVAVGDFNAGSHDRVFKNLTYALKEPAQSSGGFGFTWPSQVPLVRLDHILVRGFDASDSRTLRLGESDHRAIIATIWPRV